VRTAISPLTQELDLQISELVTEFSDNFLQHTGEPGELLLHIKNKCDRSLRWKLEVLGNFPQQWCSWSQADF
jgi:hypothetical protein